MILHIPHAGTKTSQGFLKDVLIEPEELKVEMNLMTDHYTDRLFDYPDSIRVVFPYTRLECDVERFKDPALEPMEAYGQGFCYEKTFDGRPLRRVARSARLYSKLIYYNHHKRLERAVKKELKLRDRVLIVDCHSFSQNAVREGSGLCLPDVCIGTDEFHTPNELATLLKKTAEGLGFSVAINLPFSGSLVPLCCYQKDRKVSSVMIEINRALYLKGDTHTISSGYERTKNLCSALLGAAQNWEAKGMVHLWDK